MLNVIIIGANGYVGAELVNLLHRHKHTNIVSIFVSKESNDVGKKISEVYQRFKGQISLIFKPLIDPLDIMHNIDVAFFATDHIVSYNLIPLFLSHNICVFDLSGAFRIQDSTIYKKYYNFNHQQKYWLDQAVYGLPEWNVSKIRKAQLIAVPGCYATAVQLGLKPIIESKVINLNNTPIINAISGVSGSGRKPTNINSFCEVSIQPYNIFVHRHQPEIIANIGIPIIFIPHLGSFTRGILATITCYLKTTVTFADVLNIFSNVYNKSVLMRIYATELPSIKSVVGLPFCDIGFVINNNIIVIVVAIDNLLKGAAAQAVQCFNIRFGFPENLSLI